MRGRLAALLVILIVCHSSTEDVAVLGVSDARVRHGIISDHVDGGFGGDREHVHLAVDNLDHVLLAVVVVHAVLVVVVEEVVEVEVVEEFVSEEESDVVNPSNSSCLIM